MPQEGLQDIERLIATLLPEFVRRPLINNKMCWCTGVSFSPDFLHPLWTDHTLTSKSDMPDGQWLFCEDPRWKGLFLATGDSGSVQSNENSFHLVLMSRSSTGKASHTIPFVGSVIADMLEDKVSYSIPWLKMTFAHSPFLPAN